MQSLEECFLHNCQGLEILPKFPLSRGTLPGEIPPKSSLNNRQDCQSRNVSVGAPTFGGKIIG